MKSAKQSKIVFSGSKLNHCLIEHEIGSTTINPEFNSDAGATLFDQLCCFIEWIRAAAAGERPLYLVSRRITMTVDSISSETQ
jgi:hypothetical protein